MNQTNLYKKSSGEPLCSKKDRLEMLFSMIKKNTSLPYFNPEELFVPGVGNLDAKILVIGEAPGAEESIQGKPFVGRSGQLLSKLLDESEIDRTELYITNVVKYRPPNNKTPEYKECMQCFIASRNSNGSKDRTCTFTHCIKCTFTHTTSLAQSLLSLFLYPNSYHT